MSMSKISREAKLILIFLITLMYSNASFAETLASCGNLEGHAYYQQQEPITDKNSGWKEDKISAGTIALQNTGSGYDIVYVDASKKMSSTIQDDNAKISVLNKTENDMTLLVQLPSGGSDIYRFFKQSDGSSKMALMSARTQIPKNSLMIGNCEYIRFPEK